MAVEMNPFEDRCSSIDPSTFFGHAALIERLLARALALQPESSNLFGEPRLGRSSVLNQIAARGAALGPEAALWVPVDLNGLLRRKESQRHILRHAFWDYFSRQIRRALCASGLDTPSLLEWIEPDPTADEYERVIGMEELFRSLGRRVVFLIDDFEVIVDEFEGVDADHVTRLLRAWAQSGQVAFVLSSVDPLYNAFERTGLNRSDSPLTNILHFEQLALLDEAAARALMRAPLGEAGADAIAPRDQDFVLREAGGHPELIKRACSYIWAMGKSGPVDHDLIRARFRNDYHVRWLFQRLVDRKGRAPSQSDPVAPFCEAFAAHLAAMDTGAPPRVALNDPSTRRNGHQMASSAAPAWSSPTLPASDGPAALPGLRYDERSRRVWIGDRDHQLSPREFALFRHLADHPDTPCGKTTLKAAIWRGIDSAPPYALDQLVRRVRLKIEEDQRNPRWLVNVHGQGYMLRESPGSLAAPHAVAGDHPRASLPSRNSNPSTTKG